jgi:hypothetical protein
MDQSDTQIGSNFPLAAPKKEAVLSWGGPATKQKQKGRFRGLSAGH